MITNDLVTERFVLACLDVGDVTETYRSWMLDPEVTRNLETRSLEHSIESLAAYVTAMRSSSHSYFFGIFSRDDRTHIGNIKLGPIKPQHQSAAIGLMVGDPTMWGKGVATEVIAAVTDWAFGTLAMEKLTAGSYAVNGGSVRAFQRCGYAIEGIQRSQVRQLDGTRGDVVLLGRTRADSGEPTR